MHHDQEAWHQEHEAAGHIASAVKQQREGDKGGAQLAFHFSLYFFIGSGMAAHGMVMSISRWVLGETFWNHCHRYVQRCGSISLGVLKSSQVDNKDLTIAE